MQSQAEEAVETIPQEQAAQAAEEAVVEGVQRLESIIESLLFAAGAPLTAKRISEILGPRRGPSIKEINAALIQLQEEYAPGRRGIQLVQVAGGFQLRTARENAEWVRAVFRERPTRLGRATMETLAIVAYQQPVTRMDIEAVRGVDAEAALTTLLARRLVKIAGRKEALGRPLLYATTPDFLEAFGLKDLSELPSLKELGPVPDEESSAQQSDTIEGAAEAIDASGSVESPPIAAAADAAGDEGDDGEPQRKASENPGPRGDSLAARSRDAD